MKTTRIVMLAGMVAMAAAGCAAKVNVPALATPDLAPMKEMANFPHEVYRIEAGDTVQIRYVYQPELKQEDVVRPDGKITISLIGETVVAGLTTYDLERLIENKVADQVKNPEVVVSIAKFSEKQVFVGGEVGKPGTLLYRRGLTPLQAVIASGGFRDTAAVDSVILVRLGVKPGEFIARKVNLEEVVQDGAQELVNLAPNDIVFVPRSGVADANLWVRQHITEMFPFVRGLGASMGIPVQ
jgi:protein involved in polysaccharide export with SLBB domain